jgi:predicted transcriptional regulator
MTNEQIRKLILRRLYDGAFRTNVSYELNLNDFADQYKLEKELVWKIYEELREDGLAEMYALGGWVVSTSLGLSYCEENKLVDGSFVREQNMIRLKILNAYADSYEKHSSDYIIDWEEICRLAGVDKQDFQNNISILMDAGYVQKNTNRGCSITTKGREKVKEYLIITSRLEKFERLEGLSETTAQGRGHQLEDILADIVAEDGWGVEKRVRSQGQEHDLFIHKGLHYFLVSCKWEKDSIQSKEVELLESRVRSRISTSGGILLSMSGFTDNCIEEVRLKITSALIILFGPSDIRTILTAEKSLTGYIEDKVQYIMNHRKILVDGEAK